MATACEAAGLVPVAIDGKSSRAAKWDAATGCVHVVTARAAEDRLVLGQVAVPDGSNGIGAIPDLLRPLDLSGAIATIDVARCQTENACLSRSGGGHCLLTVKDNQPTLRAAVEADLERACLYLSHLLLPRPDGVLRVSERDLHPDRTGRLPR